MVQMDYSTELEFIFADFVYRLASEFSDHDIDKLIPILKYSSDRGNYEAAVILALYYDPDGCLFRNYERHELKKSREESTNFYKHAYQLTKNDSTKRGQRIFAFVSDALKKEFDTD
jgi:hypothetical protein